jgi:hypothetical protein
MAREITSQVVEKCGIGFLYVLANNFEPMPTNNALDHYLLAGERWTPAGSSVGSSVEVEASIYGLRGREEGSGSRRGCGGSGRSGVLKRIGGTPTTARTLGICSRKQTPGDAGREKEGRWVADTHLHRRHLEAWAAACNSIVASELRSSCGVAGGASRGNPRRAARSKKQRCYKISWAEAERGEACQERGGRARRRGHRAVSQQDGRWRCGCWVQARSGRTARRVRAGKAGQRRRA